MNSRQLRSLGCQRRTNTLLRAVSNYIFSPLYSCLTSKLDEHIGLTTPCQKDFQPDALMRTRITEYFYSVLGGSRSRIAAALPSIMPSWGRIKILEGGDSIRTLSAMFNMDQERDTSFVRVCAFKYLVMCISTELLIEIV